MITGISLSSVVCLTHLSAINLHLLNLFSPVECPAGSYYNKDSQTCQNCQEGTFQNRTGQMSCDPCPAGTWSNGGHAKNFTECFGEPVFFNCIPFKTM